MEISGFFCHLDFTWNQFWSFWSSKNCCFNHLRSSEFWFFWELLIFPGVKCPKSQNSNSSKLVKPQFLTLWNQPKLISRKIRVAEKLPNFHTLESPQSKFPIRLPRSVLVSIYNLYVHRHECTTCALIHVQIHRYIHVVHLNTFEEKIVSSIVYVFLLKAQRQWLC